MQHRCSVAPRLLQQRMHRSRRYVPWQKPRLDERLRQQQAKRQSPHFVRGRNLRLPSRSSPGRTPRYEPRRPSPLRRRSLRCVPSSNSAVCTASTRAIDASISAFCASKRGVGFRIGERGHRYCGNGERSRHNCEQIPHARHQNNPRIGRKRCELSDDKIHRCYLNLRAPN